VPAPPRQPGLRSLLGHELRRAQLRVAADFERSFAGLGLTPGAVGALLLIAEAPGITQTALGDALGIDRSSVVPLVDRMEARGWVVRAPQPGDRRAHALGLAPGGVALMPALRAALDGHEARIAEGLTRRQRAQLLDALRRLAAR